MCYLKNVCKVYESMEKRFENQIIGLKKRSEELCLASAGTRTVYNSSHLTQIDKLILIHNLYIFSESI